VQQFCEKERAAGEARMDEKKIFKKSADVVTRRIGTEAVVLPLYKSSKEVNYIYSLNETAAAAWDLFDGKSSVADIRKELLKTYDIGEKKLSGQLDELVRDLISMKALIEK
jgi:hypothetical protein